MFGKRTRRRRKGNILVLSAILMIALMAMLAFAIDIGYLCLAKDELQRSADAAALAAAWELIDPGALSGDENPATVEANARSGASQFAGLNQVLRENPGLATDDVAVGYLPDPGDPNSQFTTQGEGPYNAVRVRVQRTESQNGTVPFFVARVLGLDSAAAEAEATATLLTSLRGFEIPGDGGNIDLLPFALDVETCDDMLFDIGQDNWTWDPDDKEVEAGADGIVEVNLYPQGTGAPGNRGTVDIGSSNNSTADIARQIVDGVSPGDLEYHGGKLEFDSEGELELNGDTGMSSGVKDELASIIGETRIVPVFSQVEGPGNNAQYTIIRFVGVRIMEVKLTGAMSSKRVIIQPANVVVKGGIPSPGSSGSHFVYSPVWLVR